MKQAVLFFICLILLCSCEDDTVKAERFFRKGNVSLEEGNYKEAIRLYTEAIDQYERFPDAYNNRGVAYYKMGNYEKAIADYDKVIGEMNALSFKTRANRVDANTAAKRYEPALRDLKWASEFYPDSVNIFLKTGLIYYEMKDYNSAIMAFYFVLRNDSLNVDALVNTANSFYFTNKPHLASDKLDVAEAIDPNEPNIYNTRCMIGIANRDYKLAMEQVLKALAIEPSNGIYLNNRGFLYLMEGKLDEGKADIDRAIVTFPENAWAYRNKGIYYTKTEKWDDAIRAFETAARFDNDLPLMDYYWGEALLKKGDKKNACEKLRKSVDRYENEGRELFKQNCGEI